MELKFMFDYAKDVFEQESPKKELQKIISTKIKEPKKETFDEEIDLLQLIQNDKKFNLTSERFITTLQTGDKEEVQSYAKDFSVTLDEMKVDDRRKYAMIFSLLFHSVMLKTSDDLRFQRNFVVFVHVIITMHEVHPYFGQSSSFYRGFRNLTIKMQKEWSDEDLQYAGMHQWMKGRQ